MCACAWNTGQTLEVSQLDTDVKYPGFADTTPAGRRGRCSQYRLPAGFKSHLPATVLFQTSRVDSSKSWNDGVCSSLLHTCTHMCVCLFPAFI